MPLFLRLTLFRPELSRSCSHDKVSAIYLGLEISNRIVRIPFNTRTRFGFSHSSFGVDDTEPKTFTSSLPLLAALSRILRYVAKASNGQALR